MKEGTWKNWVVKVTDKERKIVEEAEKRCSTRKLDFGKDLKAIEESILQKRLTLKALEGCTVLVSDWTLKCFANKYLKNYFPEWTWAKYKIAKGRPILVEAYRNGWAKHYIEWSYTEEAKAEVIEAAKYF